MTTIDVPALEAAARGLAAPIAPTAALVDAWRQLHYAAQVAAEVGKSWAVPHDDDSHGTFTWRDGFLAGATVPAPRSFHAALRARDLVLRLVAGDGAVIAERALADATLAEATAWVRAEAQRASGEAARQPAIPAPDLPPHPIAGGAAFAPRDRGAFQSLASLLAGADTVLRAVASVRGAGPVRVWPHHFDMATLVEVAPQRTIGVGLAVPEATEPSGYWYVSPWAKEPPPRATWPALAHGRWKPRGDGLAIAVLPLDAWAALEKDEARVRALAAFLAETFSTAAAHLRA